MSYTFKSAYKLENHSDTCKFAERISAVRSVRIDDRTCIRYLTVTFVVVGDYCVYPNRPCVLYLFGCGYSRINRDYQLGSRLVNGINCRRRHAVSLFRTERYIVVNARTKRLQVKIQHCNRGHTVNVIIPVDGYLLSEAQRLHYPLGCPIHILKLKRAVKALHGRMHE